MLLWSLWNAKRGIVTAWYRLTYLQATSPIGDVMQQLWMASVTSWLVNLQQKHKIVDQCVTHTPFVAITTPAGQVNVNGAKTEWIAGLQPVVFSLGVVMLEVTLYINCAVPLQASPWFHNAANISCVWHIAWFLIFDKTGFINVLWKLPLWQ